MSKLCQQCGKPLDEGSPSLAFFNSLGLQVCRDCFAKRSWNPVFDEPEYARNIDNPHTDSMNKKEYYCYECGTLIPEGSDPYVDKDGSIICEDCYADGGYNDCVRLSEHKQHQYDEDEIAGKCTCHSCGRTFKMTSNTFIDNKGHHYCESCFDDLCRADYDPYHYHEPSMVETPKQTMLIDLSA